MPLLSYPKRMVSGHLGTTGQNVWKNVMDYLISKLDELKDKKIYDWSATDPVAAQTLMYVARLVPSAPSKEGARKRQILPSTNSVGTVRKNVSLRGLQ